ncbi:DUF4202 domain-containing protein [Mangrovimonas xylaniphaga]|uniref:DUF4202 domain-containing protein n=1 Tax=Mangrovimonas xylaniphaga TaxID=1645915 RepID=UPI0006B4BA91|nr:DUF4202 domain-containing protein [Mangrovimonas xylaniphaga]
MTQFQEAVALIDEENSKDPNLEVFNGLEYPKELLYSQRMYEKLLDFRPDASEALKIAAKAQHICRWKIARDEYPMDKVGYFNWRNALKDFHVEITSGILKSVGYNDEFVARVADLILKKRLKKDEEVQTLEDVVCLVFLQYYFDAFSEKHSEEKLIDILQKTWRKMSEQGHQTALNLKLSSRSLELVQKALA